MAKEKNKLANVLNGDSLNGHTLPTLKKSVSDHNSLIGEPALRSNKYMKDLMSCSIDDKHHYEQEAKMNKAKSQRNLTISELGLNETEEHSRQVPLPSLFKKVASSEFLHQQPKKVLIFCKPFDQEVIMSFRRLFRFIYKNFKSTRVYVENWVIDELDVLRKKDPCNDSPKALSEKVLPNVFDASISEDEKRSFEYILTLGGDGTILWASKQFSGDYIPPLVSFAHGSLGYLCNFEFDEHEQVLHKVFSSKGKLHLDNRIRLKASMVGDEAALTKKVFRGNDFSVFDNLRIKDFHIMNEVVVDRGPSPYSI
mmetsp:Transcript_5873/g.9496  ORF Transcript_5873/g.9496 Transcript_5873/m.9496 type:complete len:311 (+) Transcript_5873:123-1055(+)